ncbi:Protein argonaute [Cyphellophora attinorum]|uniref:Protein argonaute n=1 Tax=Cyphellophora attinorum TaxID=1664694 RepID=A0A0N1H6P3_9EURO|nr:Protein argonaute [Phialophora attinorum]KPI41777.1 Protein argonaute [Phialophora attinorum]
MSGAARRRGRGRARGQGDTADGSEPLSIPAGGFDGPASRGSGSGTSGNRIPSQSSGTARAPSPTASGGAAATATPPQRLVDPALDPSRIPKASDALKNVDLPASLFQGLDRPGSRDMQFTRRPGLNTTGKAIKLDVNAYAVTQYPSIKIQQYDVTIGDGAEKKAVMNLVWNSSTRANATGPEIIWDGNKLAWSLKKMNEIRLHVNLDQEQGRRVDPNSERASKNTFRLRIQPTKVLNLNMLDAYVKGQTGPSVEVGEGINFLDHLLRMGPSHNRNLVAIKRSFFARSGERSDLGGGVEVFRGVYQSMRLAQGGKLVINVDVANTTFWKPMSLLAALQTNSGVRDANQLASKMAAEMRSGQLKTNAFTRSLQNRFKGNMMLAKYNGNPAPAKEWKFHKFSAETADQHMLEERGPDGKKSGRKVSVAQYFMKKYNIRLQHPRLPLVETTKKGVLFPIELLHIQPNQRYGAKLDETQTASMIKFAVSPPQARLKAIQNGKDLLNWGSDNYLKNYGLQISPNAIKTNARILPPPEIQFGGTVEKPGTKGRWDLRGKKFLTPNPGELVAWGIGFMPGRTRPDQASIARFAQDFAKAYRTYANAIEALFQGTGTKFNTRPQLLVILLQDKNSHVYNRVKKSADCRYGIVSQCLQLQQVLKGSPQYIGNVLMKVNAKLGGSTSQVKPNPNSGFKKFTGPTMFIGADVSHASPGSEQASMAAITVSYDKIAARYAAGCQTNGHRVEMISKANWRSVLGPLVKQWVATVGGNNMPGQVYYMRDGVSEGQFAQVLDKEVPNIIEVLKEVAGGKGWQGKLTVVVASKRHHVRAFPSREDADQKGNPLPGCLIEQDVTMPHEFDFFLYSHIALQGTSRPVHYTILRDDANHSPNVIQNMIYEHCYQYMRSTTSVSMHPAVYYAHLASNRAVAHVDIAATEGPQGGPGFKQNIPSSDTTPHTEAAPLIEMVNTTGIRYAMWYI